jgi:hypothetical protein
LKELIFVIIKEIKAGSLDQLSDFKSSQQKVLDDAKECKVIIKESHKGMKQTKVAYSKVGETLEEIEDLRVKGAIDQLKSTVANDFENTKTVTEKCATAAQEAESKISEHVRVLNSMETLISAEVKGLENVVKNWG